MDTVGAARGQDRLPPLVRDDAAVRGRQMDCQSLHGCVSELLQPRRSNVDLRRRHSSVTQGSMVERGIGLMSRLMHQYRHRELTLLPVFLSPPYTFLSSTIRLYKLGELPASGSSKEEDFGARTGM